MTDGILGLIANVIFNYVISQVVNITYKLKMYFSNIQIYIYINCQSLEPIVCVLESDASVLRSIHISGESYIQGVIISL